MNRLVKTVVILAAAGVVTAGCASTKNNALTLAGGSTSASASASPSPSVSTKVVSCDQVDKQLTDVKAQLASAKKTASASLTATASTSPSASVSPSATTSVSPSPSASPSASASASDKNAALQDKANQLQAELEAANCKSVSADQAITELVGQNGLFQGYQPGQVKVGTQQIDWTNHQELRGIASFGTVTLKTPQAVGQYLSGTSAQDVAARNHVEQAITAAGYGQTEIDRALNGSGYFPVQPTVASQILGTSYFQNGKALVEGTWRSVGPNDVYWVFMTVDHKIIPQATVRADCQNPNAVVIKPIPPGTPPPPSVTCATNCQPQSPCTQHCSTPPPPCHCTPPPPCSVCVTKASASPTVDHNPPAGPSGAPTAAPSSNFPGPTPVKDSPAPTPVPSPGYSGPPPGGSKCNPPSQSCTTGPSNPPSGTPEPVAPTQPGGGGNNSAPPSASPTEACGPLTDPYVPC